MREGKKEGRSGLKFFKGNECCVGWGWILRGHDGSKVSSVVSLLP